MYVGAKAQTAVTRVISTSVILGFGNAGRRSISMTRRLGMGGVLVTAVSSFTLLDCSFSVFLCLVEVRACKMGGNTIMYRLSYPLLHHSRFKTLTIFGTAAARASCLAHHRL